jgi:hypothetical protein
MRKALWIIPLLLIGALGASTVLRAADITYTVNEVVGAGNVTGFITTDGTIGTLAAGNIVNWSLALNDGTNPTFDLLGPTSGNNSGVFVTGSDLTSTATQLLFNFSANDAGYLFFQGSGHDPFNCYNSNRRCNFQDPHLGSDVVLSALPLDNTTGMYPNVQYTVLTGDDVIAGAGVVATPEPSTNILLLTGIVLMVVMRKRIAQGIRLDTGTHYTPH